MVISRAQFGDNGRGFVPARELVEGYTPNDLSMFAEQERHDWLDEEMYYQDGIDPDYFFDKKKLPDSLFNEGFWEHKTDHAEGSGIKDVVAREGITTPVEVFHRGNDRRLMGGYSRVAAQYALDPDQPVPVQAVFESNRPSGTLRNHYAGKRVPDFMRTEIDQKVARRRSQNGGV